MNMVKAVFIDKDGTLVEDVPYNVNPDLINFTTGAIDALKSLKSDGYRIIIVSNQSGIAHGYFSENDFRILRKTLQEMLEAAGASIDGFYFCPHHPAGKVSPYAIRCECRKPKPGLLIAAAEEHNIDLTRSWMIGDILNDVEAGTRAGCKTILINNGNETEWKFGENRLPTAIVPNMISAARRILYEPELV
jgi:D,D-heptose 1,7-bisphosphate phosphatase